MDKYTVFYKEGIFMNNRIPVWLRLCAAGILLVAVSRTARPSERPGGPNQPNVLFIPVDDLRPELGCYGNRRVKSPNIDRLARSGMVFERAYCQQAVCSPSRTSLLTGRRPDSTRVYDLETNFRDTIPTVTTLPEHFKEHGYNVVGMGKVFHGGLNDLKSWSQFYRNPEASEYQLPENQELIARKREAAEKQGLKGTQLSRSSRGLPAEAADVPDSAYPDGKLADMAVETLRMLARGRKPFFLAVGFWKPHLPFNAPKRYWDLYKPAEIMLARNSHPPKYCPELALTNWGELRNYHGIPEEGPLSADQARLLIHGYYACVSYIDAQVGRLLAELDRLQLSQNTIVVLWGDHGWKLGEHGAWCKHTNFEVDTRSTLIVRAPGKKEPGKRVTDALVEFVDIYPTLCELAGLPLPRRLEGTSFAPLLENPRRPWKSAAFSQYPRDEYMGYSVRTDRYRLTIWLGLKRPHAVKALELYDHLEDPGETVNIAQFRENNRLVTELYGKLKAGWRAALPPPLEKRPEKRPAAKAPAGRNLLNRR